MVPKNGPEARNRTGLGDPLQEKRMSTWFHLESTALLDKLATDLETGVTPAKAEQRLAQRSPNELVEWGLTNP
jgi:hypothetical protein